MNTDRVFYVFRHYTLIPRILVPGKFHIIGLKGKYPEISPWFIKWEPHDPCHYCDKGALVLNQGYGIPKWWNWQYVELGVDADKHNLPLGLSFTKGNGFNLSKRGKNIIKEIITYTDNNICTQKEYDKLHKKGYVYRNFDTLEEVILARKNKNHRFYGCTYLTIHDFNRTITIDVEKENYTIKPREALCES